MDLSGNITPIRYYDLQYGIEGLIEDLKGVRDPSGVDIKQGAFEMLSYISDYLYDLHFGQRKVIDVKALVKTLEDAWENSYQYVGAVEAGYVPGEPSPSVSPIDPDHEQDSKQSTSD